MVGLGTAFTSRNRETMRNRAAALPRPHSRSAKSPREHRMFSGESGKRKSASAVEEHTYWEGQQGGGGGGMGEVNTCQVAWKG